MWVLFYADGSRYDGPPEQSPPYGLVLIAQSRGGDNMAPLVLAGDWFLFYDGRWWNHDEFAMRRLAVEGKVEVFRPGQYVPEDQFLDIRNEAYGVAF